MRLDGAKSNVYKVKDVSNFIETRDLGWSPKDFYLPSVSGKDVYLKETIGERGLVVMFICNHCPYVIAVANQIVADMNVLKKFGINTIAISSNDVSKYPDDSFNKMKLFSKKYNFNFPYLFDETQEIAKEFKALCTPDFYGFNSNLLLQYRGRLNDCGKNIPNDNTKKELVDAMIEVSKTGFSPKKQLASIGCSIKWK